MKEEAPAVQPLPQQQQPLAPAPAPAPVPQQQQPVDAAAGMAPPVVAAAAAAAGVPGGAPGVVGHGMMPGAAMAMGAAAMGMNPMAMMGMPPMAMAGPMGEWGGLVYGLYIYVYMVYIYVYGLIAVVQDLERWCIGSVFPCQGWVY